MVSRRLATPGIVILLCLASPVAGADLERGAELFELCAQCHGGTGAGDQSLGAPSIAGLDQWYLEAQLEKFRQGIRGTHADDLTGLRMRPMAVTLIHEGDVADVSAFVASLPPVPASPVNTGGNAKKGMTYYMVCVSCHGKQGAGDVRLKAPPLVRNSDWYLLAQLRKFKAGIRGTNPKDLTGMLMRPQALTLNEQAMKDVVAYIMTMPR
jgi:cytochrome c553